MIDITFYGVRGSTPCSDDDCRGHGGNTSCVFVAIEGAPPIVLDLGTGARYLGQRLRKELGDEPFVGTALVTHLHWDHIQGLPFFVPVLADGAEMTVVGPRQDEGTLAEAVEAFVTPPLFPVPLDVLPGTFRFVETSNDRLELGTATVTVGPVEHCGPTNGYRIENGTGSLAYLSDHQAPLDGSLDVPPSVRALCNGVDVLIHDAQYDLDEFEQKATWGHSTVDYAVAVAVACGVRRLVLFHHDPTHDDAWVADAVEHARELAAGRVEVLAAAEGLTLRSGDDAVV